jgi:hypothetical protein
MGQNLRAYFETRHQDITFQVQGLEPCMRFRAMGRLDSTCTAPTAGEGRAREALIGAVWRLRRLHQRKHHVVADVGDLDDAPLRQLRPERRVVTFHFTLFFQSEPQSMTASMGHVTNLRPPWSESDNNPVGRMVKNINC